MLNQLFDFCMKRRAKALLCMLPMARVLPGEKVLDIGSGTGHFAALLSGSYHVLGLDVDILNKTTFSPVLYDGTNIPSNDNSFSAAFLIGVLQYCKAPEDLLRDIARVLQNDAFLVLVQPITGIPGSLMIREWLQGPLAYYTLKRCGVIPYAQNYSMKPLRYFDRESIQSLLTESGFIIEETKLQRGFPFGDRLYVVIAKART